jgi:hypothetical protein
LQMHVADRAAREPPKLQMGQPLGIWDPNRFVVDGVQLADTNRIARANRHRFS